jgi:hypothetical protein
MLYWHRQLLNGGSGVLSSIDFSSLSVGASATPGGLTITRASVAGAENGDTAFKVNCSAINEGRIAQRGSNVGLRLERATTNLLTNPRDAQNWTNAASGGGSSTTGASTTDPDGVSRTMALHSILSGGYSKYQNPITVASGSIYSVSAWLKPDTGNNTYEFNAFDSTSRAIGGTLQAGWQRVSTQITTGSNTAGLVPADGRLNNSIAAAARNYYSDLHQYELGPVSTWISGTRAGENVSIPAASAWALSGAIKMEVTWVPDISAANAVTCGLSNFRLWTLDANNYAEIVLSTRIVKVVIGGQAELLPNALPSWSADDTLVIRVFAGNGVPTGLYIHNGGTATSLGSGSSQPYMIVASAPLDVFCNSTTQQLQGIIKSLKIFA